MPTLDYYEVLGLKKTATQEEIKQAYRAYCKKYHPDINSDSNAVTMFRLINDAYTALTSSQPQEEQYYDAPPGESPPSEPDIQDTYEQPNETYDEQPRKKRKYPWWIKIFLPFIFILRILLSAVLWILKFPIYLFSAIGYFFIGLFGLGVVAMIINIILGGWDLSTEWPMMVMCAVLALIIYLLMIFSAVLLELLDLWREIVLPF